MLCAVLCAVPCAVCCPVVVEMTLNDRVVHSFDSPDRRAYEQLVRKALRLPSRPAVLLLHSYAWYYAFGDGATGGLFYPITEGHLTMLSQASSRAGWVGSCCWPAVHWLAPVWLLC